MIIDRAVYDESKGLYVVTIKKEDIQEVYDEISFVETCIMSLIEFINKEMEVRSPNDSRYGFRFLINDDDYTGIMIELMDGLWSYRRNLKI